MGTCQSETVQLGHEERAVCVACLGSNFSRVKTHDPRIELELCLNCQTATTYPCPTPRDLEQSYSQTYYGPENVKFIALIESVIGSISRRRAKRIDSLIVRHSNIMEVGCGRGLLLESLARMGHHCFGTERSELAAARAAKIEGITVYPLPLEECGLPNQFLDAAIAWHVLEHLQEPDEALSSLFHMMKPGGRLLLEVPNYYSIQARVAGRAWFHLDITHHIFHFSPKGLQLLLDRTGFEVESVRTFSLEQGPYGLLQSAMNGLGLPREQLYRILKREYTAPLATRFLNYGLAVTFALPSLAFSILESILGNGAVLSVTAKKPVRLKSGHA